MELINNSIYLEDVKKIACLDYRWNTLKNKNFVITGATGLIGSFLIDVLMYKNKTEDLNCTIYAIGRNKNKAQKRFKGYFQSNHFFFLEKNINDPFDIELDHIDFLLHAASNTHPKAYATDPIGTITANVIGLNRLLEIASQKQNKRFIFLSSVEIYGENRGDTDKFSEDYLGYINCNTLRAGYPESKRVGEALCQAYISQKNMDIVIPRLSRVYGPSMLKNDSKALSQFINKALSDEDIVLKSEGTQYYSYSYVADAVSGILKILFNGKNGEAYNLSNPESDVHLKELANIVARTVHRKVVFELPNEVEKAGYSTATTAILDTEKIQKLGWYAQFDLIEGIQHTIRILEEDK